jgi:hypothetical protein
MRNFTLRRGFLESKCGTHSSFKGFVMLVVMMLMMASSAMAQDAKFEVIDGLRYLLDTGAKTAALVLKTDGQFSGSIVIPEKVKSSDGVEYNVTSLGDECFKDCRGLTSVTIPSSITSLGNRCFDGCSGLTSVTIPSSITSLSDRCFRGCEGLTSITIPSSVTSLGGQCFESCSGLTSITIPSSVTSLGNDCFDGCSGLTSITIPSSVTSLEAGCFASCSGLTSITIPSSVTSLGGNCFFFCRGLTSITIPSSVTLLDYRCFEGCSNLTSITIPSSVTFLGDYCFRDCSGLTSITIPSSVTSLGEYCFEKCGNIETYYFKGALPKRYYWFPGISPTSIIKVPTEYLQDYKDAFGPDYKYIYGWDPNGTGDDNKPVTQCATPSISYASGELKFTSETTGAKYHYTINDKDMATDALSEEGKVSLSAAYKISVYATADGYKASDKAEATLYWINANLDNGTNINQVRTRGVVASAHDGIISLSGLDDGEVVKFFADDGKYLGSTVAANGAASYAVSESLVIAKVGKDSIKIAMK